MRRICLVLENLHQRGQALVEFAFTLPLFLMMLFTIIYGGWVFTDYMTFSNIARDCTNKALTVNSENLGSEIRDYAYNKKHLEKTLRSGVFVWNPNDAKQLDIEENTDEDGSTVITIHIRADLDTSKYLGRMVHSMLDLTYGSEGAIKMEKDFLTIDYSMYKDPASESKKDAAGT